MMLSKKIKHFFAVVLIILFKAAYAQVQNDYQYIYATDTYGRAYDFSFGKAEMPVPTKISIRSDTANSRTIEFLLQYKKFGIDLMFLNRHLDVTNFSEAYFDIDSAGNVRSNPDIKIDLDLKNLEKVEHFVISYGNCDITAKKKIRGLMLDPRFGRPLNLSELSGTRTLILELMFTSGYDISSGAPYACAARIENYPGDPLLLNEISQMQGLESLIFYYLSGFEINPYFIDSPTKKLFELPNLKFISVANLPYLPIPGNEWQKIEFFQTKNIFYPELVNLALVLNQFNKDTNDFNWKHFLNYGNDSSPLIIPENGKYQSFYDNGVLLCEGNYLNGKEDGEWKFWYRNGGLCEHRVYKEGIREGEWYFMRPADPYYPQIDTILKLTYRNDTLIYRQDKDIDTEEMGGGGCYYYDSHTYKTVLFTADYWINYKQNQEVVINKTVRLYDLETNAPYKQFPAGKDESWEYTKDGWTYKMDDYCNNKKQMRSVILRGNPGATSYYSLLTQISTGPSGEIYKTVSSVDLQNCFWQSTQFTAENESSEFKIHRSNSGALLPYNLPCKNP